MKTIRCLLLALCCVFAPSIPAWSAPEKSSKQKAEAVKKENLSALFKDGLFRSDGKEVKVSELLKKKKFIGIYGSASWCGACRHFTPRLIEFYKKYNGQMEVVLLGLDDTQDKVFKYMKDYKMPWLTMKKGSPAMRDYMSRNKIRGVPCFYLYETKTGKVLVDDEIDLRILQRAITGEKSTSDPGTNEDWKSFFANGLFSADGKSVSVDALKKKKYIGLYCIDDRSEDCAKFTAALTKFYKRYGGKIEIIFYTYGKDKGQLRKYAKDQKMPWLGMEPNSKETQRFLMKYKIKNVPDLRIFDAKGKLVLENGTKLSAVRKAIGEK